jgi:predicted unusual protein kinase regulating ubiquinone biosynthesis (AarF/ABC1/UbiB family)
MAKPPTSPVSRIARLGGLTSRISGSYLGQRIAGVFQDEETRESALRKLHLENAERVVETMGALKGAAMKVGQSLAQVVDGMDLPPEMASILGKLNNKAQPVPFDLIRRSVEAELGAPLAELFADFDPEPLGTASLAQAHAARLKSGERVVVKVLHEGIEKSVDADLAALKSILITGRVLNRDKEEIDAIFDEIRHRLGEELDYFQEAANLEFFKKALARFDGVEIPGTHPQFCTGRVLTMDRLTGASLDDFLPTATPEARQRAGTLLVEAFHDMVYRLRAVHADPHGGNYLFRKDGGIGILDFGCVKRFDPYWIANYARMARAAVWPDPPTFFSMAREIDVLRGDDADAKDLLWRLSQAIVAPLQMPEVQAGGAQDQVLLNVKALVPQVLRHRTVRGPRDLIFLHRALGGTHAMLRRLEHRYPYQALFDRTSRHAIAVAEGRVADGSLPL